MSKMKKIIDYRPAQILKIEETEYGMRVHIPVAFIQVTEGPYRGLEVLGFRCPCCGRVHHHGRGDGYKECQGERVPHCGGRNLSCFEFKHFLWILHEVTPTTAHLAGDLGDFSPYMKPRSPENCNGQ